MSEGNSRGITSNQTGPHNKLVEVVQRHLQHQSQKPFSEHTLEAFEAAQGWLNGFNGDLILDSCCGVGESTANLAKLFPQARIIGIDKSALRTGKHEHYDQGTENHLVLRADVIDFWRLAKQAGWKPVRHYLLYPNPYPKSAHLQRRWHASPSFADIVGLGGRIEVRSNWRIYIEEFAQALQVVGYTCQAESYQADTPMTPFERKYWNSGQQSWRVVTQLA